MKHFALTLALGLLSFAAAAQDPNTVVQEAADLLAQKLEGRKEELTADREKLYALIDEILLPRFDRRYAAQLVLAKHWRTAGPEQRERFIDAFYASLLQKYADGVLDYDQSRIEILPFRGDESRPFVTVRTTVRLDDGTRVPVDYNLRKNDGRWMLFDVIIEGISYVRNFRAELDSEIQSSDLDAVIARLQAETGNGRNSNSSVGDAGE